MNEILIFYDNWCPRCTNFAHFVKKQDVFNLITLKKLREVDSDMEIDISLATKKMASNIEGVWFYGYATIYKILIRLPIFWIFAPLLWILQISGVGSLLYFQLALRRKIIPLHCEENCSL